MSHVIRSASPIPRRDAVEMNLGRHGPRWYVVEEERTVRGGPYATREDAEAAIEAWHEELAELYDWVEAEARRGGYSVQW